VKNHINELFDTFSPKEEQKDKMFHKMLNEREHGTVKKSKYFSDWKGILRPVIACMLCLFIMAGVFTFGGGGNSLTMYAYGENLEITNTGVELSTGEIHDDGSMKGQLVHMYVKGENIETIRFSCKNQYIDFTDWTESRPNFSMEKQFTGRGKFFEPISLQTIQSTYQLSLGWIYIIAEFIKVLLFDPCFSYLSNKG
jgi:hypothetical protein